MPEYYSRTLGFNFAFIYNKQQYGFTKITGLETEIELEAIAEGGVNGYAHMVPAPRKQGCKLTLETGVGPYTELDHLSVGRRLAGVCEIIVYQNTVRNPNGGEAARRYSISNPIITACRTGALDSRSNAVLIETLELVCPRLVQTYE